MHSVIMSQVGYRRGQSKKFICWFGIWTEDKKRWICICWYLLGTIKDELKVMHWEKFKDVNVRKCYKM